MGKIARSSCNKRWLPVAAAGLVSIAGVAPASAHPFDGEAARNCLSSGTPGEGNSVGSRLSTLHPLSLINAAELQLYPGHPRGKSKTSPTPFGRFVLQQAAYPGDITSQYEHVFGTSMELTLSDVSPADAATCEKAVLAEIDRLAGILSTYDAGSEISSVMRGGPIVSPELGRVLDLYQLWSTRTAGAIEINLGRVKHLWNQAQHSGRLPELATLRTAFAAEKAYNIDALGKGFIIDRAAEIARRLVPAGLLNIGGDLRCWGEKSWTIAVTDPFNPADNAPPAAQFSIRNAAVASSGSYARAIWIAGARYSHLIDPRTLRPVIDFNRNATVVAGDCVTANAVSTARCVLDDSEEAELTNQYASGVLAIGEEAINITGELPEFHSLRGCPAAATPAAAKTGEGVWPKDYRVEIPVIIKTPDGGKRAKRPYVAVWIEDSKGTPVRNVAVWGNKDKYLPDLSTWFKLIRGNLRGAHSIAAATRAPGTYALNWDGRNDNGQPVPQGSYTVRIEINREHGQHAEQSATIKCGTQADSATAAATAESDETKIEFKKAAK